MAERNARGQWAPSNLTSQGNLGFAVGNLEFLEGQESRIGKYFRSIEYGTHGFIGTPLFVLGSARENAMGKVSDLRDARKALAREMDKAAEGEGEGEGDGKPRRGMKIVKVRHEIAPMGAYEKAWGKFDPVQREKAAIEQAFRDSGLESAAAASGKKPRGRSNSSGAVGASFTSRMQGRGFIKAGAISTRSRSLAQIDRQFQSNLREANRLLAEALAAEVALAVRESLKRPEESQGWMEEATLDGRNRFPR